MKIKILIGIAKNSIYMEEIFPDFIRKRPTDWYNVKSPETGAFYIID